MADFDVAEFNRQLIPAFRESGGVGKMGPVDFEHLVLLTTTGRRSHSERVVPLGYAHDDDDALLLFASNNGAPTDPQWFRNIAADPAVRVEITGAEWRATAQILDGAARDAAYARWTRAMPNTAHHQERAGRQIPMVRVPRR